MAASSMRLSIANAVLVLAVMWSALAVIQSSHACRQLYAQLQDLQSQQWRMQEQYGRLLLEESTWAGYHRIEQVAQKRLGMRRPAVAEVMLGTAP